MEETKYYAMIGSERVGPMGIDELRNLGITPQTPVWRPGMADWATAATLPELSVCFGQQPPYQPYSQPQPQPPYGYNNGASYFNQPQNQEPMPPRPDNYLVWAIVVTILCCLVGGIVALVYSSKVNSAYDRGDYAEALKASNSAKTWCIVSAIVGFIGCTVYTGAMFLGTMTNIFD